MSATRAKSPGKSKTRGKSKPTGGPTPQQRLADGLVEQIKMAGEIIQEVVKEDQAKMLAGTGRKYQAWYTRSLPLVKLLAPERLEEFVKLYEADPKRKQLSAQTYALQDYFRGFGLVADYMGAYPFDVKNVAFMRLCSQRDIVFALVERLADSLSDIQGMVQADLFDSELDAARELAKNGHLRAAGAVAGVVLESHLGEVSRRHGVGMRKKDATIGDYNDALKRENVADLPNWRWVQRLGDLRNLCTHKKNREPTVDEVNELIEGTDKALKVFF